ncbi:phosphatase 2C 34 [Spatholobus suberectus]|nr:phosphatase 2C 34 [Spatholobus suberectus]
MVLFPSLVNGLARTVSLKKDKSGRKGNDGGRKAVEALAKEARKNELLLTSTGIVKSSKANNVASVFTKNGQKGFNQDSLIVWEVCQRNNRGLLMPFSA